MIQHAIAGNYQLASGTSTAQAPARDVSESHGRADEADVVGIRAAGEGGRDDRARAHTGDAMKGNAVTLDETSKLTAGHRPHIAISRICSFPPAFGVMTSTDRQPSTAS